MIYGYIRVSSDKQTVENQTIFYNQNLFIQRQRKELFLLMMKQVYFWIKLAL